ncbi:MAG: glycosyltransferase family 2 protein [Prevotella sp.]
MKAAVIILNWNGAGMMRRFLPSVIHNTPGARIVVADNASTDDSLSLLATEYPGVETLRFQTNYGFAEGYNKAIASVEAEYIVLLNSDVEVGTGWLDPLLTFMDSNPVAAACQPKILSWHDRSRFEYAGAAGGYIDMFGYPYCRGRIFSTVEADHGQYDDTAEIHWATGACLVVRRELYLRYGGLDSRFFAHNEEIDFCWRLRRYGWKIYCVPASVVWHVGGGTLPQGNPHKTYLNFRNNLLMLYKNLPASSLRRVMLWRCVLDHVAMLQALLTGHPHDTRAIMEARRDYRIMRSGYAAYRDHLALNATSPAPLSALSILWQYYVMRRRTFSSLP